MLHVFALFAALEGRLLDRLVEEETGGVVIEYGIVVAVIALGLVTAGQGLVQAVIGWFGRLGTDVNGL